MKEKEHHAEGSNLKEHKGRRLLGGEEGHRATLGKRQSASGGVGVNRSRPLGRLRPPPQVDSERKRERKKRGRIQKTRQACEPSPTTSTMGRPRSGVITPERTREEACRVFSLFPQPFSPSTLAAFRISLRASSRFLVDGGDGVGACPSSATGSRRPLLIALFPT